MKILFLGDVVGRPGRNAVQQHLSSLQKQHNIDFTIVNGENAAHGKGITKRIFNNFMEWGVDVITLGNHAYSKDDVKHVIDEDRLVRPMNLDPNDKGKGFRTFEIKGKKVLVANVMGEVFMYRVTDSPYDMAEVLKKEKADIKIIDFHAEATAEKLTFLHRYKNDFTAILGTHTHVQTADEDIFNGCAYISDVGMCGPYESIIGRDIEEVFARMIYDEKTHYTVSKSDPIVSGVVIEIDDETNRAVSIERIQIK